MELVGNLRCLVGWLEAGNGCMLDSWHCSICCLKGGIGVVVSISLYWDKRRLVNFFVALAGVVSTCRHVVNDGMSDAFGVRN